MSPHARRCLVNRRRRHLELARRADDKAAWWSYRAELLARAAAKGVGARCLGRVLRRLPWWLELTRGDRASARNHRALAVELRDELRADFELKTKGGR